MSFKIHCWRWLLIIICQINEIIKDSMSRWTKSEKNKTVHLSKYFHPHLKCPLKVRIHNYIWLLRILPVIKWTKLVWVNDLYFKMSSNCQNICQYLTRLKPQVTKNRVFKERIKIISHHIFLLCGSVAKNVRSHTNTERKPSKCLLSIKLHPSAVSVEHKVLLVCSAVQETAAVDGVTDVMVPNQL